MSEFTDPAFWQRRPPEPPKGVPISKIVYGTLIPLVAIAALAIWVVTQQGNGTKVVRSLAAYNKCLVSHVSRQAGHGPGTSFEAFQACDKFRPAGVETGVVGQTSAAEARVEECIRNSTANLPHGGFGRGGPSAAFRAAIAACQSLAGAPAASSGASGAASGSTTP